MISSQSSMFFKANRNLKKNKKIKNSEKSIELIELCSCTCHRFKEKSYINNYWVISENPVEVSVSKLVKDYQSKYQKDIPFDTMVKTLKSMGYSVKNNIISNITEKPIKKTVDGQGKL